MLKTIKEYLPITSSGIFSAFNNPVWSVSFQDSSELDKYFLLRYGDRIGNKLIDFYKDSTDGTVKGDKLIALSKMIYDINAKKWDHLYNVYMAEYNPIENTDFVELISDVNANTRGIVGESSNSRIIDEDGTSSGSATTESSGSSTGSVSTDNSAFAFNSATAVGTTESDNSDSNTTSARSETSSSGTTSNDTSIRDSGSEESTITDNGIHTSEHRKHGNIGVTENTTMLEHEVAFWKWSFIDSVCKDICDIIALSIY